MTTTPDKRIFAHNGVIIPAFDEGPCEPDWPIDWNFEFIPRASLIGEPMILTGDAQTVVVEKDWD